MIRHILYSPGRGNGWSTYYYTNTRSAAMFVLMYQPLVDHILACEGAGVKHKLHADHPLAHQFKREYLQKFEEDDSWEMGSGGFETLQVYAVPEGEQFQVREVDGIEWVVLKSKEEWL